MSTSTKVIGITTTVILLALAAFLFFKFFFVLGEGVKAGELNQVVYKGWVWKTYEGRLIQSGFKGAKGGGSLQSNEFNFSITDPAIADSLMRCGGKLVELKYTEYNGSLPWRGMQKYIVYDIISVRDAQAATPIPIVSEE